MCARESQNAWGCLRKHERENLDFFLPFIFYTIPGHMFLSILQHKFVWEKFINMTKLGFGSFSKIYFLVAEAKIFSLRMRLLRRRLEKYFC